MQNNRTLKGTILEMLLPSRLWQPLMFADPAPLATVGTPATPPPPDPAPALTPPPTPTPTPPSEWQNGLSDDIKESPSLTKFKNIEELAKSYLEGEKLLGRKGVILPLPGATEEQMGAFYNELGRPEKPEGYKIDEIQMPAGVTMDENARTAFINEAHKLGLMPHQVNGLIKWQTESEGTKLNTYMQERETSAQETETALRSEYGIAYSANLALAKKVINNFADDKTKEALNEGLGDDPRLIKMIVNIGKALGEDTLGEGKGIMTHSPTEALAEIAKIRANKDHPYHKLDDPGHKAAVEHFTNLYKQAYPEPPQK